MSLTEDFFSMDFSDLGQLIKELDMFDERCNHAVLNAIHKAGDMIEAEQKRIISDVSKELPNFIMQGNVYLTKKDTVGITVGYQSNVFEYDENGFNPGIVGTMFEFGRPGKSNNSRRSDKYRYWHYYNKKGTFVFMKQLKGTIQPRSHIRRGFDNVKEQVVQMVIDSVMSELGKIFNE